MCEEQPSGVIPFAENSEEQQQQPLFRESTLQGTSTGSGL
jgi:hypothetical protein